MTSNNVVLLFDMDGTLVDNRFSRKALGQLLAEIAVASGKSISELAKLMGEENERRQQQDPDNVLTMDWDDILETLACQHGVTLSRKGVDLWQEAANAEDVIVYDNAHAVLDTLKQAGYRLVIATKGLSKYQDPVLRVTGLATYFDDILTPDNTGYLKTSPAYFDRVRRAYPNAQFIQVGDHHYDDVICPLRNGFKSILRAPIAELADIDALARPQYLTRYSSSITGFRPECNALPHAIVISLEEVPALIEQLL